MWLLGMSGMLLLLLLPFACYPVSVPFVRKAWALSHAEAALVFSFYLIGLGLSSIVLVPLTDRVPAGRILLIGAVLLTVSHLLFPLLARGLWSASALRLVSGAGHVAVYVPGIRLVAERFAPARRGGAVSLYIAAGYAGTTSSYLLMGELLGATQDWRRAYLWTGAIAAAGVPLAFQLLRGKASAPHGAGRWLFRRAVARDRPLRLVNLAYALHTAELYLARLWLPLLLGAMLVGHGETAETAVARAASLSGLMFTCGIAGVLLGGHWSDRLGRTGAAAIFFALSGACSFVIGWLVGWPPIYMIGLGFVYGFVTAADGSIYSTAVTELSPPEWLGSAQALQSFTGFTAGAIAPLVAGILLDRLSGDAAWGVAFAFSGLLAIVGVAALWRLRGDPRAHVMAGGKR